MEYKLVYNYRNRPWKFYLTQLYLVVEMGREALLVRLGYLKWHSGSQWRLIANEFYVEDTRLATMKNQSKSRDEHFPDPDGHISLLAFKDSIHTDRHPDL